MCIYFVYSELISFDDTVKGLVYPVYKINFISIHWVHPFWCLVNVLIIPLPILTLELDHNFRLLSRYDDTRFYQILVTNLLKHDISLVSHSWPHHQLLLDTCKCTRRSFFAHMLALVGKLERNSIKTTLNSGVKNARKLFWIN